ncbi:MAG: WecB/TagA/CpsF family glycosyltransferase [Patescibacteria group bacterium]
MKILGVQVDEYSKNEIRQKVEASLRGEEFLTIATLNPEMLLFAEKNSSYAKILNSFDLKIVDGFGLQLAGLFKFHREIARFPGSDLAGFILKKSLKENRRVALINKKGGLSNKRDLESKFGAIQGVDVFDVEMNSNYSQFAMQHLLKTEILLVGLGAPEQEKFIQAAKDKIPNLKLAIGVGGTLDFWSGKQKRAPRWMRKIGLEWLYRFCRQPKRYRRIFNAIIIFPFKVFIKN